MNAWAARWPGFRTRVLAWGSYMVVTEPIPERLAALGWTGGEAIADSRFTISYFRTTRDGRIAFGAGVGSAGYDGHIGPVFTADRRAVERVVANFRHLFPMLGDVRFDDAWGGPIDITADRFPEIGSSQGGAVLTPMALPATASGPAWPVACLPPGSPVGLTPSPPFPSSGGGSASCLPSRFATSAREPFANRSSGRTTRSTPGVVPGS